MNNGRVKDILNSIAHELDILAFVAQTEGEYQSEHGSGDPCTPLSQQSCDNEDMTVDIFILTMAELLRRYAKQIKDLL